MYSMLWYYHIGDTVCTEELQAAGDVTLDKETIEQLRQAHKELKIQLQTENRTLEGKKAM